MYWQAYEILGCLVLLVGGLIGIVVFETAIVLRGPFVRWWTDRLGVTDSKQSEYVSNLAVRLASPAKKARTHAAKMLGELNDVSAVPALIRAAERHGQDGHFLEVVVKSLDKIGDSRAVPLLRKLSTGHHHYLMSVARQALERIEPASVLLRPAQESTNLLRPAHMGDQANELLRPVKELMKQDNNVQARNR